MRVSIPWVAPKNTNAPDSGLTIEKSAVKASSSVFMRRLRARRRVRARASEEILHAVANAQIFSAQGKAINEVASRDIKVLVVGNPANTNALIASKNAKDIDPKNFTAMTRLDHNRALALIAEKCSAHVNDVKRAIIWGNHSATQYPDLNHATVAGKAALSLVEAGWYADTFIPTVQQRGAAIIKARGASSAASAASAAIDHVRTWMLGSAPGDYVSMGVPADGSYGIPEGVIYSYPVTTANGRYTIVPGLAINDWTR